MARGATSSTTPPSGRRARVRRPRRAGGDACDSRRRGRAGGGDPVGAGEEAEEIVEAPVLQVDDDDVVDLLERGRRCGRRGLTPEPWASVHNQRQRGQRRKEKAVVSERPRWYAAGVLQRGTHG